jgi:hypothetical protein
MAYLLDESKQENVFYNIQASKDMKFGKDVYDHDSYLPEWKRLRLLSNMSVVLEPRWRHRIIMDESAAKANQTATKNEAKKLVLWNATLIMKNGTRIEGKVL